MTTKAKESPVAERARDWINSEYNYNGQFAMLERKSSISAQKWKNLYYKRQGVTAEMLNFIEREHPEQYEWVINGKAKDPVRTRKAQPEGMPTDPSSKAKKNLKGRLLWVIGEWASPKGEELSRYLEERSHKKTEAQQWMDVIFGENEPTNSMIELVCKQRPEYAEWVATGEANAWGAIDPTSKKSVENYKKTMDKKFVQLTKKTLDQEK